MTKDETLNSAKTTVAKTDDGTVQITFTIPYEIIKEKRNEAAKSLSDSTEVPGFRKGKAPVDKVLEHVSANTILEKTLSYILPELVQKAIVENNIKALIYPKFELVKAIDGEDWQIRAVTCEAPVIELGDYKKKLSGNLRASHIWTPASANAMVGKPGKDTDKSDEHKHEHSREEKEQELLKNLIEVIPIKVPKVLIQEEADARLSNLLQRIEKLGLSLESYLSSTGKTALQIRQEYEKQAQEGLSIDFILSKIAEEEKIEVDKSEVDASIKAASQTEDVATDIDTPERRNFIEVIIKRRKALDSLLSLA